MELIKTEPDPDAELLPASCNEDQSVDVKVEEKPVFLSLPPVNAENDVSCPSVCRLLLITCSGKQLLAIAMVSVCKLSYSLMTPFVILRVICSSFQPVLLFMCIILTLLLPKLIFPSLNALWYITVLQILIDIINIILTHVVLKCAYVCAYVYTRAHAYTYIYIYIYMCVCVCTFVHACMFISHKYRQIAQPASASNKSSTV